MDENTVNKNKSKNIIMSYDESHFAKLIVSELTRTNSGRAVINKYTQTDVREFIEGYKSKKNQEKLVEISKTLYVKSQQYKRLIQYFSDMALFAYVLLPSKDIQKNSHAKILKQYTEVSEMIDKMKLKHEMVKVLRTALTEDVFYGYIHSDKNSFHIQKIDSSICKITHIEDSVYNFSIDMSYFESNKDELRQWADEVIIKYRQWEIEKSKKGSQIGNYVELSPENTICIKANEELLEVVPPFVGTFDSVFDIDAFKKLRKNKEELGNYMILVQKLPMRTDTNDINDFVIDKDMMVYFHNMASNTVPDNVGVITSPMDINPIRFDKDRVDNDGVAKAERDFWAGSGTSQALFSVDKNTSKGIELSIKTDEQLVFALLTQIERWVNRYLKYQFKDLLFNADILDLTYFNKDEMLDMYIKSGNNGMPVRTHINAIIGMSPAQTVNMAFLENDLLKLDEKLIPLKTSHTLSNNESEGGRPEKKDGLSEEGDRTRDSK